MKTARVPILLNYYALANQGQALIFGQVVTRRISDLSFTSFSRRTTFRTLLSLYRSRALSDIKLTLHYGVSDLEVETDGTGFFMTRHEVASGDMPLHHLQI